MDDEGDKNSHRTPAEIFRGQSLESRPSPSGTAGASHRTPFRTWAAIQKRTVYGVSIGRNEKYANEGRFCRETHTSGVSLKTPMAFAFSINSSCRRVAYMLACLA